MQQSLQQQIFYRLFMDSIVSGIAFIQIPLHIHLSDHFCLNSLSQYFPSLSPSLYLHTVIERLELNLFWMSSALSYICSKSYMYTVWLPRWAKQKKEPSVVADAVLAVSALLA